MCPTMTSYLITGTSRGLGLTLAQHLLADPSTSTVIATARSKSAELAKVLDAHPDRAHFIDLDINDEEGAKQVAGKVATTLGANKGLDVLINNAGIMSYSPDGIASM